MHINIFNGKYQYYKFDYIRESWYIQGDLEKEMNNFAHITGHRWKTLNMVIDRVENGILPGRTLLMDQNNRK